MTDQNQQPGAAENTTPQAGNDATPASGQTPINSLPPDIQKYIEDLRKEAADHRKRQKDAEKAAKEAEDKRLADQQEWRTLAESRATELAKLQPIAEQHEAITAAFNASLDNRLKQIPEDIRKRTVDPIRENMSPVQFSNWLDANLDILRARQAPGLDGGAGTTAARNGHTAPLTAEEAMMADAMGIPHAAYAKRKAEVAALRGTRDEPITRTTQE